MFATNVRKTHPKSLTAIGQTSDTVGLLVMLLEMSGDNQSLQDSLSWKPERACKNSLQSVEPWRSFVWAKVVNWDCTPWIKIFKTRIPALPRQFQSVCNNRCGQSVISQPIFPFSRKQEVQLGANICTLKKKILHGPEKTNECKKGGLHSCRLCMSEFHLLMFKSRCLVFQLLCLASARLPSTPLSCKGRCCAMCCLFEEVLWNPLSLLFWPCWRWRRTVTVHWQLTHPLLARCWATELSGKYYLDSWKEANLCPSIHLFCFPGGASRNPILSLCLINYLVLFAKSLLFEGGKKQ